MHKVIATYPKNRSKQTATLGTLSALVILILLLLQLFGFEELPEIVRYFWNMSSNEAGLVVAALLTTGELLALPALLGMMLSPLMRWLSAASGGLVVLYWTIASLYAISLGQVKDSGIFGDKFSLVGGLLLPIVVAPLIALISAYWLSAAGVEIRRKTSSSKG
jgi:hypothetical protein